MSTTVRQFESHAGQRPVTIYVLCDPYSREVRYVGRTVFPLHRRLEGHYQAARRGYKSHVAHWVRSLDRLPIIKAVLTVAGDSGRVEQDVIALYLALGYRLTNLTVGGDGAPGRVLSAETRSRMSAAHKGKTLSEEHKAKLSAAKIGKKRKPYSTETRAKISAHRKGNQNWLGRKHTPESIAKMKAGWVKRRTQNA